MTDELPRRDVAFCPHCGNDSPQRLVDGHSWHGESYRTIWYALVACETCNRALLYISEPTKVPLVDVFSLRDSQLVWPAQTHLPDFVPEPIRRCYREAALIKRRAPNAFANQIGRALEALCKDRGTGNKPLAAALNELAEKGEIPATLARMTDLIRIIRNIGSHAGEDQVDPNHVDPIDDFFKAIVEYVYIAPRKVQELKATLDRVINPQPLRLNAVTPPVAIEPDSNPSDP